MTPAAPLGAVVLAGGHGRRLGGAGKASVEVGGETLVAAAVEAVRGANCDPVLVVTRPDVRLPPLPVPAVTDDPGPAGPLNALLTGLVRLSTDDAVVLACDLPFAGPVVARLAAYPPGSLVVAVDPDGRPQPLCARYPRQRAVDAARAALAAGERRVRVWCEGVGAEILHERAAGEELLNVNTVADLERARTA